MSDWWNSVQTTASGSSFMLGEVSKLKYEENWEKFPNRGGEFGYEKIPILI